MNFENSKKDEIEEGDLAEADTHRPTAEEINQRIKELKERRLNYAEMLQNIQESEVKDYLPPMQIPG